MKRSGNREQVTGNRRLGKIGVLAGGPSNEREISLRSGRAVCDALVRQGCEAIFLDVRDDIHDIIEKHRIDVAFIALHGRFGEDGTVQRMLENAKIPYTGSGPEASRFALDKVASKEIFKESSIPMPRYVVLDKDSRASGEHIDAARRFGFPLVVKPQSEGSSIGLSIVKDSSFLKGAIDKAFGYGPKVILEEYISGRELTVGIMDDEPLPVIEIVTKRGVYDFSAKYEDPETNYLVPAPIEAASFEKAKDIGKRAHASLGCRSFSRVDMMMDSSGNIFVLEVNTIPGMTERSLLPKAAAANGISFGELCVKLTENALKNYKYETKKV